MADYLSPNWDRCALLTIDTQNDFTLDDGAASVPGTVEIVPRMAELLAAFRAAGRPIVHVVRLYLPDGSNVDGARREAVERGARMAEPGTPGAELMAELRPKGAAALDAEALLAGEFQPLGPLEWVMYKSRWGAFYQTALETFLRDRDIDTIVFSGCNFPNCPRTSLYEASERDFRVVAATDAISGVYEQGLSELRNIGAALLTAEAIAAWVRAAAESRRLALYSRPMSLRSIWRYPVKSMLGERLDEVQLNSRGVEGDRLYAVREPDGKLGSGKTTRRFRAIEGLFRFRAYFDGETPVVLMPDAKPVRGDDEEMNPLLREWLKRDVELSQEAAVSHLDAGPISILTGPSLRRMSEHMGQAMDERRFRPNLVLEGKMDAFEENNWSGKTLAIGSEVRLRVTSLIRRCVMVNLPQEELKPAPNLAEEAVRGQ